jgi:hypothetical protein
MSVFVSVPVLVLVPAPMPVCKSMRLCKSYSHLFTPCASASPSLCPCPRRGLSACAIERLQVMTHSFFSSFNFDKLLQSELESPIQPYAQSQLMFRMEQLGDFHEIEAPPFFSEDADWYAGYIR